MMKKFLVTAIALAALAGSPATAADLSRPAYKAPPPVFSWTGCYVGGNAGALLVHREFTDRLVGDSFFGQTVDLNTTSWIGGIQGGCNYQFAGGWVVGIQGDYDWSGHSSDSKSVGVFFNNLTGGFTTKNLASVTGRVGYAWDRFLYYVKGGAAWERDDFFIAFANGSVASLTGNSRSGWTVGVGGEWAITNWITTFIEYDYYGFGSSSDNFVCGPNVCVGGAFPMDRKENKSVIKVGLNFLWGGVGMARY